MQIPSCTDSSGRLRLWINSQDDKAADVESKQQEGKALPSALLLAFFCIADMKI